MLATDGHFTFTASKPQLACAAFVIGEPNEVISLELYDVSIDCSAGDFIKVGSSPRRPPPQNASLHFLQLWELQEVHSSAF